MDNHANGQSVIVGTCNYIDRMFGKHLYDREKTYNGMKYQRAYSLGIVIKCSIWGHFMYSGTPRIQQDEIIERLINLDNRKYNIFESYNQ